MDPEDEAPRAAAPGWPPPHPSPPLPPPREYGTPGAPLAWRPWLWGVLAALVVGALVTVGLVLLLPDAGDRGGDAGDAGRQPTTSTSATVATTPPAPAAPYRCWDGSDAQKLKECSHPKGVAGLRWVFPAMADDRCGKASKPGDGAVLRVLCVHVLEDGTTIGVGYFEWSSVQAGKDFYGAQGLTPTKARDSGGRPVAFRFFGVHGQQVKSASLFVDEPLSFTITFPEGTAVTAQDVRALSPRPVDQLRGAPVG